MRPLAMMATLLLAGCFSPDPTALDVAGSTGAGPQVPVASTGEGSSEGSEGPGDVPGAMGESTGGPMDPGQTSEAPGSATSDGGDGTTGGGSQRGSTGSSSSGDGSSSSSMGAQIVEHYVFITENTYSANLGGLEGADALCSELGASTEVDGPWRAVLRDAEHSLASRISIEGVVLRLDGETVNVDAETFFAGVASNPVDVSEAGGPPTDTVAWVGSADSDCQGWTSSSSGSFGRQALSTNLDQWLSGSSNGPCSLSRSLYCISQPGT